ncbi:unnamed protein product [Dicrocoelium dendriticum]|nr:unnamed protein product [Dicrocoelium dendriticum]
MAISFEQMQQLLHQQQVQFERSQKQLFDLFAQKLNIKPESQDAGARISVDAVTASITEFIFDESNGVTFESWFKKYEDIFRIELEAQDDAWKVRLLLRKLGAVEHERYTNFVLPKNPRDFRFDETVTILKTIFGEQASLFSIRYHCFKLVKSDIHDYITHAAVVNRECERFKLGMMTPDQFKSLIFVCSLQSHADADVRTRILHKLEQEPHMTLQDIAAECQRLINLKHDTKMIENAHSRNEPQIYHTAVRGKNVSHRVPNQKPPTSCWNCGGWHFVRFCSYRKHLCQKCKRLGHKESHCHTTYNSRTVSGPKLHTNSKSKKTFNGAKTKVVLATCRTEFAGKRKYLTVEINNVPISLQLDTASDITIISRSSWMRLGRPPLRHTNLTAQNASGEPLRLDGEFTCEVKFKDLKLCGTIYLISSVDINLLGIDWIERLNLLSVPLNHVCSETNVMVHHTTVPPHPRQTIAEQLQVKYACVFQPELGHCNKMQAKLTLLPDVTPVFRPRRPVPYASQVLVEHELDRLQQIGVIEPINFSPWAAPIVVIKKPNGSIRLCADFSTGLNDALQPHQYPLPLPDDLFAKLNGGKYFATLDLADAYLQLEVEPESRKLLTINTHRGLYQYNRLPFGVKTAPAIFQQVMDAMLTGITGAAAYLDDIIIMGTTQEELFQRLDDVMMRIKDYGFRLRAEKCKFFLRSVKFLGFVISERGRHPDPENIELIDRLPTPTDVTTLRSFLGMVSHYGQFLPAMHRLRQPLNHLLTKDVEWKWSRQCQQAFEKLKSLLKSDLLLTHYNPNLEIILTTDASSYGIGAVISHRFPDGSEKAVAHAARALTPSEKNYSQIEKEALAIVFAVQKFHKMIYGRRFTLVTDHKPLLAIFGSKKGIPAYTASRLQRWATLLLGYEFNMRYSSTDSIGQADALSRLIDTSRREPEDAVIASITTDTDISHMIQDAVSTLPLTARMVQAATSRDTLLQKVLTYTRQGWPKQCPDKSLAQFFTRRDALSEVDACLFFADRLVIPEVLRQRVLRQLHKGHPGIARMKALARSYVFWPSMDSQIEDIGRSCSKCCSVSKLPVRTTLQSWPRPESPWSRIHVDFVGPVEGTFFLVIVDAYSKWPEVTVMRNTSSNSTILALKRLFSQYGLPQTIVSDNGSQFTSYQFADFCAQNGIQHMRTAPYHPQSNGQAERYVDTLKRALLKSKGEGTLDERLENFLLNYRVTPNPNAPDGKSPAEALMGRRLRTTLDLMTPKRPPIHHTNSLMETHYNKRHGARHRNFRIGDAVFAAFHQGRQISWIPGQVVGRRGKVMYDVRVGRQLWVRHANQLRPRITRIQEARHSEGFAFNELLYPSQPSTSIRQDTQPMERAENEKQLRPTRRRRCVQPMQVDPRRKTYTNTGSTISTRGRC